jgi:hypothetical protein
MKEINKSGIQHGGLYGVLGKVGTTNEGKKGFLQKISYYTDSYTLFCLNHLENGNTWFQGYNLETAKNVMNAFRVFEFASQEEMFGWLGGYIKTPAVKKPAKKNKKVYRFEYPIHGDRYNGYETRIVVAEEENSEYIMGLDYHTGDGKIRKFLKWKIRGEIEKVN